MVTHKKGSFMAFDSRSGTNSSLIFLVDDRQGDWFDQAEAALCELGASILRLNHDHLEGKEDGWAIQDIFAGIISTHAMQTDADVFVVSDSFFGVTPRVPDGGSRLLARCRRDVRRFRRGVIYSKGALGEAIIDVIERVQRDGQPDAEMMRIFDFFAADKSFANTKASTAHHFYVVDLRPDTNHDWQAVIGRTQHVIGVQDVAGLPDPALVVVHGADGDAVARIANQLAPKKQVAVVFVSGAGYPRDMNSNKPHPLFYFRRHNEVGPGLGECLRRFWTVYREDSAAGSDAFDLLEPVGLRDLVREVEGGKNEPGAVYVDAQRRIDCYERAKVKVPAGLLPDAGPDESGADILARLKRAADVLDPPTDGIGEPPWVAAATTLRHDYLGRIKQLTRRGHDPDDLRSYLLEPLPGRDGVPAHAGLPSAMEAVRGQWQVWTEELPHAVGFNCLELYERSAADLRAAVRAFLANPQDPRAYDAVRADASDLSEFLTDFASACTHSQTAMLNLWRMHSHIANDRAARGSTDV
jgi:hypothetical protein